MVSSSRSSAATTTGSSSSSSPSAGGRGAAGPPTFSGRARSAMTCAATLALVEGERRGSDRAVARGPRRVRARRPRATQVHSASGQTEARWLLESLLDEVQLASWRRPRPFRGAGTRRDGRARRALQPALSPSRRSRVRPLCRTAFPRVTAARRHLDQSAAHAAIGSRDILRGRQLPRVRLVRDVAPRACAESLNPPHRAKRFRRAKLAGANRPPLIDARARRPVSVPAHGRAGGGPASSGDQWRRSRTNTAGPEPCGGTSGVWSTKHEAAMGGPTRLSITSTTSTILSRPWARAVTRSPTLTLAAGFTRAPLRRTCPPRHASVASVRDLNTRTAQSQRSILVDSTGASLHGWTRRGRRSKTAVSGVRPGAAVPTQTADRAPRRSAGRRPQHDGDQRCAERVRFAAIRCDIVREDAPANHPRLAGRIAEAASNRAQHVVLSGMFATGS